MIQPGTSTAASPPRAARLMANPMTTQRALHWCIYASTFLGWCAYAIAEHTFALGQLLVLAGSSGWWLTRTRAGAAPIWRGIPRWLASLILLVIAATTLTGALRGLPVVSVFAGLLASVLVLKLWQDRRVQDYGQMATISLFLTIAATLSDNSLLTGLIVILQMPVLVVGAMLYQVCHAQASARAAAPTTTPAQAAEDDVARQSVHWRSLRAPLLIAATISIIAAMGIAGVVFVLTPRGFGFQRIARGLMPVTGRVTGFSDQVNLNNTGEISESGAVVLEVTTLLQPSLDAVGGPETPLYLRGAVLDLYERGRWRARNSGAFIQERDSSHLTSDGTSEAAGTLLHVNVRWPVEGARVPIFSTLRPYAWNFPMHADADIHVATGTGSCILPALEPSYDVFCTRQPMPEDREELDASTTFPEPRVGEIAARILRAAGLEPDPAMRSREQDAPCVRALEAHLRKEFTYTLSPPVPSVGQDPTVWFLEHAQSGHCEFFASALTALCRSVGIPARVVTGFLTNEYDRMLNGRKGAYLVRASHAHAWVEARVGPGDWRTFDATPEADPGRAQRERSMIARFFHDAFDSIESTWNSSVVSFDRSTQQRFVVGDDRRSPRWLQSLERSVGGRTRGQSSPGAWKWWAGGVLCALGVALLARAMRKTPSRAARGWAMGQDAHAKRLAEEVYRALERKGVPAPDGVPLRAHVAGLHATHPEVVRTLSPAVDALYAWCFSGRPGAQAPSDFGSLRAGVRRL